MKFLGQRSWTVSICGYTSHHDIGNLSNQSGLLRKYLAWEPSTSCSVPLAGSQTVWRTKQWRKDWFVSVGVCLQCDSYCRTLNNMNELHGSTYMQILSLCTYFSTTWSMVGQFDAFEATDVESGLGRFSQIFDSQRVVTPIPALFKGQLYIPNRWK